VGGVVEPVEVGVEGKDVTVVDPQAFPDCIASLDGTVKNTDFGFVAMKHFSVNVHEEVFVGGVEIL
jgi:hypothetical protein